MDAERSRPRSAATNDAAERRSLTQHGSSARRRALDKAAPSIYGFSRKIRSASSMYFFISFQFAESESGGAARIFGRQSR